MFNWIKKLFQKFKKKERTPTDIRSEFFNTDLNGGILVEYEPGLRQMGFFTREIITNFDLSQGALDIKTEGRARLYSSDHREVLIERKEDSYHLYNPLTDVHYTVYPPKREESRIAS